MLSKQNLICICAIFIAVIVASNTPAQVEETNEHVYDVVIAGGGIAGTTAAYYLKDYDIKVFEKRSQAGGRAFSLKHNSFVYACGAEYLGKLYGPLKTISKDLNLNVREIPYPMDIYYDRGNFLENYFSNGKFYYGEMGRAILASKKASLDEFQRFGITVQDVYQNYRDIPELDLNSSIASLDNITARQWFEENKFSEFFINKYNVTFKGLFGAGINEISALSALTEINFDYENVNMEDEFSDITELTNDSTPGKYKTGSYSFDHGIAEIPLAVARFLGKRMQTNSEVIQIEKDDDLYFTTYLENNIKKTVQSESIVLAVPAPVALKIAKSVLGQEQKEILAQVEYAPFITVALISSDPIFNQGFDLAVPDGMFFTDVYDATWIQRYYNKSLKNVSSYITTVYIAPDSYKDKSMLSMSDKEILSKIYVDLEKIFPGVEKKVDDYKVFRFNYGYPVMTLGAYKRLTRLHNITEDGLQLAGDYTIYPTLEAAADSGVLAAEKIREWLEE